MVSRHHPKSHSRPAMGRSGESISIPSIAALQQKHYPNGEGDRGHLSHRLAAGTGPPMAQLFCCARPQEHTRGAAIPCLCVEVLPSETVSHDSHSGNQNRITSGLS